MKEGLLFWYHSMLPIGKDNLHTLPCKISCPSILVCGGYHVFSIQYQNSFPIPKPQIHLPNRK